jgi:hypothetical protein
MMWRNDRFTDICSAREFGMTWKQIAEELHYVDAASAAGSFRVMLRKRGLRVTGSAGRPCPVCGHIGPLVTVIPS